MLLFGGYTMGTSCPKKSDNSPNCCIFCNTSPTPHKSASSVRSVLEHSNIKAKSSSKHLQKCLYDVAIKELPIYRTSRV